MKKPISKDLKALAEVIQGHLLSMGLDNEEALKEVVQLTKKVGTTFNGDRLYIAYDQRMSENIKKVQSAMKHGIITERKIAKHTGISRSEVQRIKTRIKNNH